MWLVLLFWDMKPPQAIRHPLDQPCSGPLRMSRQRLSAQRLSTIISRMLRMGDWSLGFSEKAVKFVHNSRCMSQEVPACLLSLIATWLSEYCDGCEGVEWSFRTQGAPCAILFKPGLRIFVVCFVVIPVTLLVCLWADTQQTANHYIVDLSLYQSFIYNRSG